MYKPNDYLKESVEKNDVKGVKSAISMIIHTNPNEVEQAIEFAQEHGVSLFEEEDESYEYDLDQSHWTKDYFAKAITYLGENFTHKRLQHVLSVRKKLYTKQPKPSPRPPVSKPKDDTPPKAGSNNNSKKTNDVKKKVLLILGIAAVILTVIGIIRLLFHK